MTDEVKQSEGENQEQPGQHQQQKKSQDVPKQPNSSHNRNDKEVDEKQDQPEQGGQRRAS
jgi:hypothetical protein